jgi:hypothetical protein
MVETIRPTNVTIPNADDAYLNGLPLVVAGKVYRLPSIRVYDTCAVLLQSSPLNGGLVYISKSQPSNSNSIILFPGQGVAYKLKNPNIYNVMGTVAGDVLIISCEIKTKD